jgi:hypothetical protein
LLFAPHKAPGDDEHQIGFAAVGGEMPERRPYLL